MAANHFWSILAWAIVSATIGIILHLIEERAGFVGQIVVSLVGGAWALVTFFVVPVLVLEDKGVVDSVRESVTLIRKTWGESIVGSGSMLVIFVVIGVLEPSVSCSDVHGGSSAILFGSRLALFLILVGDPRGRLSAMQGIFVTALYTYAKTGTVPSHSTRT